MRRRMGGMHVAQLLGVGWAMGWRGVVAEMCEGAALDEFERCMGDCDGYTCLATAFSGEDSCEVVVNLGLQGDSVLPAEGVWQMQCEQEQRCNVLRGQIGENLDCCPHGTSLSEYFAVCPNELPSYTCSIECAPTVLYFWSECSELYQNHTEHTAVTNDGLATIPLADALANSARLCQDTLYREGAKAVYDKLAVIYFPFAGWIILMVPFLFFLLFVFFGRHLSSLFRMVIGAGACSMQILWPALAPFIARCGIGIASEGVAVACDEDRPPLTADVVFDIAFAALVAVLAGYTCRQMVTFGNIVQGFTLGFVVASWTTDLWIGSITQEMSMDFVVLAISTMFGAGGAALNVFFPVLVNMIGSSVIGSFCCCQIFCIIGYFNNWQSTFPVSLLAAGLGVAGCDSFGCYAYLSVWILLAGAGIAAQKWSTRIEDSVDDKKPVTVAERILYKLHQGFKMLLDMEASIAEHSEYHSKEEMQELAEQHAATWAAAATALSDACLLTFGASLVVCGAELVFRGVYSIMEVYLIFTGLLAILFTLYEMQVHSNVSVTERVRQFDIYIWGIFICIPFAATGFFVSLSLGLDEDPLGLHDDFSMDKIRDEASTDGSTTYRTFFMRHMQVAMVAFFGLFVSSITTCAVVSKNIGGWLYLMRKVHKFVAGLLLVYGAVIAYVGFELVPDETFTGKWIFELVGGVGVLMVFTGVVGVIGHHVLRAKSGEKKERSVVARNVMLLFVGLLFVLLSLNLIVFVSAGVWASNVNVNVAEDWSHINTTLASYCEAQAARRTSDEPCHLTQDEFAAEVLASLQLAMAVGIVTSAYMWCGFIAAVYMAAQTDETLSHADALVQKHAKEYLGALHASEKRKKLGKRSAVKDKQDKEAVLGKSKKGKKKKKKRVKLEKDANGEWTATADPPPPPDGDLPPPPPDDGFPPPPPDDDLPLPPPDDDLPPSDEVVENPIGVGHRRIGSRTLGADRVLTKVEKKAIERQKKQQAKLQAQQQKRDKRNAKAAAKRAAKRERSGMEAQAEGNAAATPGAAAAAGATFDVEDGSMEKAEDAIEDQVGMYQWVTDSDAESESSSEYHYQTTDSDPDDV